MSSGLHQIWYCDERVCIPMIGLLWSFNCYRDDVRSIYLDKLQRFAEYLQMISPTDVTFVVRPVQPV